MTFTTELSILEYQSPKSFLLNEALTRAYDNTITAANDLNLVFCLTDVNIKRLLIHNIIIEICEFKKKLPTDAIITINRGPYDPVFLSIVDEIIDKIELNKRDKSVNFLKTFKKYLRKNGLHYLYSTYLKQVNNKLALFR